MGSDPHFPSDLPNPDFSQDDWDEVRDNPELTDEEPAQGVPLAVAMPELVEAIRRQRGEAESTRDFVWVHRDVIGAFRDSGSRWQVRLNDILKEAIARGALDPRSGKLRPSEAHSPKPMADVDPGRR